MPCSSSGIVHDGGEGVLAGAQAASHFCLLSGSGMIKVDICSFSVLDLDWDLSLWNNNDLVWVELLNQPSLETSL